MASLPWVILDRVARRSDDEDVVRRGHLCFDLAHPPGVTAVLLHAPRLADGLHTALGVNSDTAATATATGHRNTAPGLHSVTAATATGHGNTAPGVDSVATATATGHGNSRRVAAPRPVANLRSGALYARIVSNSPGAGGSHPSNARMLCLMDFPPGDALVVSADRQGVLLVLDASIPAGDFVRHVARAGCDLYVLHADRGTPSAAVVRRLPPRGPSRPPVRGLGSLCLASSPGQEDDEGYIVAELQLMTETRARLLTYRSSDEQWAELELDAPVDLLGRAWGSNGTLSHEGKMWWVDLRRGIISWDPTNPRSLLFERFPGEEIDMGTRRCVNVSDGLIRCAEIQGGNSMATASIAVWARIRQGDWRRVISTALEGVWSEGRLPSCVPDLVMVHPILPNIVYCCFSDMLLGLDVGRDSVVHVQDVRRSAWLAWELPEFIRPGYYPRGCGVLSLLQWDVNLCYLAPGDLIVSAQPNGSSTVIHVRLWIGVKAPCDVRVRQLPQSNSCRVLMRHTETNPLLERHLPLEAAILKVPVPDFNCIFKTFTLREEGVQARLEAPGRQIDRGYYVDGKWRVDLIESMTTEGPVLLLRFSCADLETFGAQLIEYPEFDYLEIWTEPGNRCRVKLTTAGFEVEKTDVLAVRMVLCPI
ncbi:hypothetical protein ACP4OV_019360 [Aristida adscensionis]